MSTETVNNQKNTEADHDLNLSQLLEKKFAIFVKMLSAGGDKVASGRQSFVAPLHAPFYYHIILA